jgi:hypothetical protein
MNPKSANFKSLNDPRRCTHTTRNGRCRLPAVDSSASFCSEHARQQENPRQTPDPEVLAAELLGDIVNFTNAGAVNLFLGNLVKQLARKRIARRDAIALAYLCQLLLNSLPPMWKEIEWKEIEEDYDATASQLVLNNITHSQPARHADQQSSEAAETEVIPARPA